MRRRIWPASCLALRPMVARVIITTLLLAQLADTTTFMIGLALHGIGLESNGIAVAAYRMAGLPGVLTLKGGAIVVVLAGAPPDAGSVRRDRPSKGLASPDVGCRHPASGEPARDRRVSGA